MFFNASDGTGHDVDLPEGAMITYVSPFVHKVVVQGLDADTPYVYKVGAECEGPEAWSNLRNYKTPPAGGQQPASGVQTVAVMGDMGQTQYTNNTVYNVLRHINNDSSVFGSPETIMIVGDLAYADGDAGLRWDSYEQLVEPMTSAVNTLVMPGNHEIGDEFDAVTGDAMVNYVHRYFMPGNYSDPSALKPFADNKSDYYNWGMTYLGGSSYYALEQGLVTFIALNTYNGHKYGPGSHMYEWLVNVLENVDRSVTPWVIVGMHAPWYNTNSGHTIDMSVPEGEQHEPDTYKMARVYEPLFNQYKVNFVFSGHVHAYERFRPTGEAATCPVDDMAAGPTYITVGDGGNHERLYIPEILADFDQLHCSAYRNNEYYGFGLINIYNATTAEWVWAPNREGSERIPSEYHDTPTFELSRMSSGYADQVVVGNYALENFQEDMYTANVHV